MYKKILIFLMIFMLLLISGCAKKSNRTNSESAPTPMNVALMDNSSVGVQESKYSDKVEQNAIPKDKKIIQNFQVSLVVEDVKNTAKEIGNRASSFGGYTEMEEIMEYGSNAVIRIPSQKADLFIEYLEKSFEVTNKNKSIEDVTEVYVDNEARLKNLRAEESQVLEILKKANTVDEILKVQSELYKIREEIEVLESRKKNWDRQVDYSTVKLNISKKQIVNDKKIKILSSNEFFNSMGKGFKNTFMTIVLSLQTLVIFLFSNLIPIIILGGLFYIVLRVMKKNKKI